MLPLATSKKLSIFALRLLHIRGANHRFYYNYNTHRRSEYHSYCIAICESRISGKATLSLYSILTKIKFFTNATFSRKFSTAEREYAATNAQPCDKGTITTQSIKKEELGAYPLLSAIRLLFREFYGYVRSLPTQMVQDFFQNQQYCYTICPDQRQGIFRQRQHFFRSLPEPYEKYTSLFFINISSSY